MPHVRLHLPASRLLCSPFAPAKPGGRLFGRALVGTGILLLAVAAAPMLVGAQSFGGGGAARDPGVRGGAKGAGGMINGLTPDEQAVFTSSKVTFQEVDDVAHGLGPRFNLDSCAGCHAQPDVGGSSPALNPQVAVAHAAGAKNLESLPFIRSDGPVREVRFQKNPDGTADGGVHDLFTITGRTDAQNCQLTQPDFGAAAANHNMIFRIPTPTFGAGLIEMVSDTTIAAGASDPTGAKARMGITGHPNREGNTGTITRFGWKAQNKSLTIFSGEAYNVEQGVTNVVFPNERDETPGCVLNGIPESVGAFQGPANDDVVQFSAFMSMLAPPTPGPSSRSTRNGSDLFNEVGCALCHTPSLKTGSSTTAALSNQTANLYSDLLVHNMGTGLADGVSQGNAGPDEFRSAPLWGLGQRIFFLHDGRTNDLEDAIDAHSSPGSEANGVINRFNRLSRDQRQDILNFLRSL